MTIVIDANKAIAGRLASHAAKQAQNGEDVVIVNAEHAVISGNATKISTKLKARRGIQNKGNPEHTIKWPRRPDLLLKKMISGMVPKHAPAGKAALEKIHVYLGVPKEFEGKAKKFEKTSDDLPCAFTTLSDLCRSVGWKK